MWRARAVSAPTDPCVGALLGQARVYVSVLCIGAGLSAGLCLVLFASQRLNLDLSSLFQVDGIDLGGVKNQL